MNEDVYLEQIEESVQCPFCGERFTILVDSSQSEQRYIEDCYVCCRPIQFTIRCSEGTIESIVPSRE